MTKIPFSKNKTEDNVIYEKIAQLLCDGVLTSFNDLSIYKKIFSDVPEESIIKRELVGFEAFVILVSISSYYKKDKSGLKIFNTFLEKCEDSFVRLNLFETREECDLFTQRRINEYSKISQHSTYENYLIPLSRAISKNFGSKTLSSSVAMASIFVDLSKANIEFLDDLNKIINQ